MRIVWFSWKDRHHPQAGGAEVVQQALIERLVAHGHEVHLITSGFRGGAPESLEPGYHVTRVGSRWSVYFKAAHYYRAHVLSWADVVIDEMNTLPFMASWYSQKPTVLLVHMLCREIWHYEMPFPLNWIGYYAEPMYLRLLHKQTAVTVSESTRKDLVRAGFRPAHIHIISEGITLSPVKDLSLLKFSIPTILALGSIRSMKRTREIVYAFELARDAQPNIRLVVAGAPIGRYGKKLIKHIEHSRDSTAIEFRGAVSLEDKIVLLQKCHLVAVTSVKEGWGLVVTEAASQGSPAIVYDVDGLRDSVRDGETGVVCRENTPLEMAHQLLALLHDTARYGRMREAGWRWSQEITFERSYADFISILEAAIKRE